MPSAEEPSKKRKIIRSAFDSETFDKDVTFHVDGLVGSATISTSGRDVALASPDGLAIIDLDSPYSPPRRLSSHGLPWLVVDVQWSPFAARDYWVASTANHRCLIWNLNLTDDSANGAVEHSLQGHSRAITDINFAAHHPDFLATCAVDGYVHKWDLRRPRQPVLTFCDWYAGATQIRWNRQDPNLLASSHDRWLHIWDERNPSQPLKSINAHTSKIYGIDWNRTRRTGIVTCSLDKTIKFWDIRDTSKPEQIIRTDFPVWRARHTPFGWGLLAMPQDEPGNLYLYDRRTRENEPVDHAVDPVAVFPGHGNYKVKEFLWRTRGNITDEGIDNREFQLVSWGEDNKLRLHRMEPHILDSVGYAKGCVARRGIIITRKGATYKTFRSVEDHANRERRTTTMSDPRPGSGNAGYRRSALTMGMRTMSGHHSGSATITSWRGPSMKAKSTNGKTGDRSLDQLGWMKGITMSKKRTSTVSTPQRKKSEDSTTFQPNYDIQHWDESETLQDEILRISQQMPNVHWDDMDMHTLILDASLNGPWGTDGESIHVNVKVDVPRNYPKSKAPKFVIEKTAFMSDEMHKKLGREVNQIATQFAKRRQNCLEAAFSYLLGETDLTDSTAFFKNVRDFDEEMEALADESSSESSEDDDIPAGGSASMSQELPPNGDLDNTLAPMARGNAPPMPRYCGARWSNNGKLVCFFPSKEEKRKSLFITESYKERPKGEPTFAGFGRLQEDSPPPRQRDESSMMDDRSDTDDDDDSSSSSSSDSETTYMQKISMWDLSSRRFRKAFSGSHSMRSSGGGTGIETATGTGTSRRRLARPKNVVCLYDLTDLLPSKQEFAQEYAIFGDGPKVCEKNAVVAEKYGRLDLVHVWKYAALLLRHDIPLELLHQDQQKDSVLVVAKDVVSRFKELEASGESADTGLTGRVKWGLHPLAKGFISELFDYFERISDVQMLAMLSCVFSEATAENSVAYAESHLSQPETPLPMKAPSFSLEYFPVDASLWHINSNLRSQANSGVSTPKSAHTPIHISGSTGSEDGIWPVGESGPSSYSYGEDPHIRTPYDTLSETDATKSLSTSPETRLWRRNNANLGGFTTSLPRPFASAAGTSPPSRKRPSPGEKFLSNLPPSNITWGGSTILGPTSDPTTSANTARNSQSDDEQRRDESWPLVCYDISVQIGDQSIFDDDGWLSTPLLESSRRIIYSSYRYAYAELLQMWDQSLARLEIMKFNVLKEGITPDPATHGFHDSYDSKDSTPLIQHGRESPIALGKKEQLQVLVASDIGLDVTGICRVHEIHLDPLRSSHASAPLGGAVGTCERCKRAQMQLFCVYCSEPIDAQYVPCLGCGCALHEACLAEWHAMGETECPAGDECNCPEEACSGQVETWAAMMGVLRQGKGQQQLADDEEDNNSENEGKNGWETLGSRPRAHIPTIHEPVKTPFIPDHSRHLSAARQSLGDRLRQSGRWGSTSNLRKGSRTNPLNFLDRGY